MGDATCKSKMVHNTFAAGAVLANSCVFVPPIMNTKVRIAVTQRTRFAVGDNFKTLPLFMATMNLLG